MTRKARLWTGTTMLIILMLNYAAFSIPLAQRSRSIEERAMTMVKKQFESGIMIPKNGDDYILEILKKEKAAIDNKLGVMNMLMVSFAIIIASWTLFGLISNKGGRK
jgi:hypothetical protein